MTSKTQHRFSAPTIAALLVVSVLLSILVSIRADAAVLSRVEVRFDRMAQSTVTTGTVCARPATTSTDVKTWTVTFPTGYTLGANSTFQSTNISTTDLAWPSGASAWPNATSATASVSGQTVTWTNASAQSMNNSTLYCYNWLNTTGNAVTTASSPATSLVGSVATQNSSAVTIDSGSYTTSVIADDQIDVSATVPSTFSFALNDTDDPLGTLSTSSVSSSSPAPTATINTNAKNGWQVWAKDANTGLYSASANATIPSLTYNSVTPSTVTASTSGYNTGVTSSQVGGSGTITVDAGFNGTALNQGGGLSTTLRTIATSNGTADTAVLTLKNNVAIGPTQAAAADYVDTITVIGAGLF